MIVPRAVSGVCQRKPYEIRCFVKTGVEGVIDEEPTVSFPIWLYIDCCCESCSNRVNSGLCRPISAHLIIYDCGANLFDEADHFLRILPLVEKSYGYFLLQQSP